MIGEYIIYYEEKIIGGICDDRFLVKLISTITVISNITIETQY